MKKVFALSLVAVLCLAVVAVAGDDKMAGKKMGGASEGTITKVDMAGKMMMVKDSAGQTHRTLFFREPDGNIIEIYHQRMFHDVPVKKADIDAVVETRNAEHVREIVQGLNAIGFPTRLLGTSSVDSGG